MTTTRPLTGKVALVAGGTRGAGRGIARELGAAGATVYVTVYGFTDVDGSRPDAWRYIDDGSPADVAAYR
ncbi:hypothetical protein [Sphaerisporangium siamense]|uniref:NAD(P)-dependent dehydrogenase (Short-subunit alcohol dehydrogenase family) n=1 Tax=Sphaerisporangium siamense TaxID=795645 RepID=A0A7W7D4N8_9ACTN|nr:NAD(P)-dependent dehydrogenase (short-subunit alcohol dehydrogenase family) [Sphaerisporangium siamense]